jgi:quercetin dioxygenase-like cupin family protein
MSPSAPASPAPAAAAQPSGPQTPDCAEAHAALAALATRFVQVDAMPWRETRFPKIKIKVLMEDKTTGLHTTIFKWEPGAELPFHEHVALEQSFVLEGALEDDEGVCSAGNYVWRPAGSRHSARAPNGAVVLGFFLKPNVFFDQPPQD